MAIYVDLNLSGYGGLGTLVDPIGIGRLYSLSINYPTGTEFNVVGECTLTGNIVGGVFSYVFNPWLEGIPWRINGNTYDMTTDGSFTLRGGICYNFSTLTNIGEASGCALISIGAYSPGFITGSGIKNCLMYWLKGYINSGYGSMNQITNSIIIAPDEGWPSNQELFADSVPINFSSGNITNVISSSGVYLNAPSGEFNNTYSGLISSGDIPAWNIIDSLENFCLGFYASGIGPINFISGVTEYADGDVTLTGISDGEGYIFSNITFQDNFEVTLIGSEKILGLITFIYPLTDGPPTSSGIISKSIKSILTNKNRYPYKTPGDTIISKVDILQDGRLSYLSGIPIELWMNYSGIWNKCEDATTDRYGSCYITHIASGIPNITNCLGIIKAIYNGGYYVSNLMRYNFYSGVALEDLEYIIDATATGIAPDRLNHHIFNGIGRLNLFDRMYSV